MAPSNGPERPQQNVSGAWHADTIPTLMVTLKQARVATNLSEDHLREVMHSGALPSVLVGRSRRIRLADLQAWVAGLPRAAA